MVKQLNRARGRQQLQEKQQQQVAGGRMQESAGRAERVEGVRATPGRQVSLDLEALLPGAL